MQNIRFVIVVLLVIEYTYYKVNPFFLNNSEGLLQVVSYKNCYALKTALLSS